MPEEPHETSHPRDEDTVEDFFDLTPDDGDLSPENLTEEELLDSLEFSKAGGTAGESSDVETLRQEKAEVEEKLLRTAADYQNFVRRSTRELEATRQQRVVDIARALVTVLDHFDRALQVEPETTSPEEVLQGVGSIRDELLKALGSFGVTRVDIEPGTEFDPNQHEALMHQPHDDFEAGQVVQTFLPGYVVNDTPVRPAQVSVAQ